MDRHTPAMPRTCVQRHLLPVACCRPSSPCRLRNRQMTTIKAIQRELGRRKVTSTMARARARLWILAQTTSDAVVNRIDWSRLRRRALCRASGLTDGRKGKREDFCGREEVSGLVDRSSEQNARTMRWRPATDSQRLVQIVSPFPSFHTPLQADPESSDGNNKRAGCSRGSENMYPER